MDERNLVNSIRSYYERIGSALGASDLEALHQLSVECDVFLRGQFPEPAMSSDNPVELLQCLSDLSDMYRKAIAEIEQQKLSIEGKLCQLSKNRSSTNSYLDVAGSFE